MNTDKKTVIAIIFGFVWFSVFSWYPDPETKDLIRTALGLLLCVFLFLGHSWSRWVVGGLSVVATLGLIYFLIVTPLTLKQATIPIIMLLFYSYAGFMLINPKLLKLHFKNESV